MRTSRIWLEVRSSLWFVPSLLVIAAIALAVVIVEVDSHVGEEPSERWPRLFGAGAEGSRGMLTAVATSMITVAGVTFSITIVALSLASTQYSPRILRNFMRDRRNQVVLGVFLGIFTYCVVVLRTIRGGDEGAFVPSLAVLVGVLLGIVGIGVLILFIHHIADAIQASTIIANITSEALAALDRLHPERLTEGEQDDLTAKSAAAGEDAAWTTVTAPRTGFVRAVDAEALAAFAREHRVVVHVRPAVGDFVVEGTPLLTWRGRDADAPMPLAPGSPPAGAAAELVDVGRYRTVDQDPAFALRQLVDIAQKTLSPGINDVTTAVSAVQHVSAILSRAASRRLGAWGTFAASRDVVLDQPTTFEGLLAGSFSQLSAAARGHVAVLLAMVEAAETIARFTPRGPRLDAIRRLLQRLERDAEASLESPDELDRFREGLRRARVALDAVG